MMIMGDGFEKHAWIFTLGTELAQGRVINTNGSYIGRRLTLLGVKVIGIVTIIDNVDLISKYLMLVLNEGPRFIVTTGGLGPTYDDRTLEAIAKALNRKLVLNVEALEMVRRKYEERKMPLTPERMKMAYLPEGGVPVPNPVGTAPGCWIEYGETVIVSLPGVPREMEAMWENWVEPRLRKLLPPIHIAEAFAKIIGVPESSLAIQLNRIVQEYEKVYVKSHPLGEELGKPVINIYVMASGEEPSLASKLAQEVLGKIIDYAQHLGGSVTGVELKVS
uniref:Nicotinamide mononucleotide deamidase-related protein n=1 Tax=Ignisphaera aggregans TaxID=334771 RepID=A0A7J2U6U8_9CREN